jgi:hypothetical protein
MLIFRGGVWGLTQEKNIKIQEMPFENCNHSAPEI